MERGRLTTLETITVDGVEYVRAYPVADGRCPCCGLIPPQWTPARIVAALVAWAAEHGRGPKQTEWEKATPDHPDYNALRRTFGSFRKGLAAAGVAGVAWRTIWTPELIITAMLDWHFAHGEPPRVDDWRNASSRYPSERTVRVNFGTFNKGIEAAGLTPRQKGSRYKVRAREAGSSFVDAAPIAEVLRVELASRSGRVVAAELGMDEAYVCRVADGRIARIRATYADRILTALGHPHLLEAARAAA
jgi:hypothetical protein